jgi:hypothetical protein
MQAGIETARQAQAFRAVVLVAVQISRSVRSQGAFSLFNEPALSRVAAASAILTASSF